MNGWNIVPLKQGLLRECIDSIGPDTHFVELTEESSEQDIRALAANLLEWPRVGLMVSGFYMAPCDLSFLKYFGPIPALSLSAFNITTFDPVRDMGQAAKYLYVSTTHSRSLSLKPFCGMTSLRVLGLCDQKKHLEQLLCSMPDLIEADFRSSTVSDLDPLAQCQNLQWLKFGLGGMANFQVLSALHKLRYLELWRIKGIQGVDFVTNLLGLEELYLDSLNLIEALPSLGHNSIFKRLTAMQMKNLSDIAGVMECGSLEMIVLERCPRVEREAWDLLLERSSLADCTPSNATARTVKMAMKTVGMSEAETGESLRLHGYPWWLEEPGNSLALL